MRDLVVLVTWKCPDCQFYSITDEPDIVAEARAAHQRAHYEQTPPERRQPLCVT